MKAAAFEVAVACTMVFSLVQCLNWNNRRFTLLENHKFSWAALELSAQ